MCEEIKSKPRQPWEFERVEADRVGWVGGCCMGSSNCGVVPDSTRRNTDFCLYLDGPFPLRNHSNGHSIAPLLAGSTVAAQPPAPELKELSHRQLRASPWHQELRHGS